VEHAGKEGWTNNDDDNSNPKKKKGKEEARRHLRKNLPEGRKRVAWSYANLDGRGGERGGALITQMLFRLDFLRHRKMCEGGRKKEKNAWWSRSPGSSDRKSLWLREKREKEER